MNLTLRQIAVFVTTAKLKGVTRAAAELSITQSAASQSLKELESILGYQVFNRIGRELWLNDHGRDILPKAVKMLDLQEQLQNANVGQLVGELAVAASVTIGCYILPQILADFTHRYPLVKPKLYISNSAKVIERLNQGQAHVGFIEAPMLHDVLTISAWRDDHLSVFCASDYPLAKQTKLTASNIAKQRWILREAGSGTRSVFISAIQQQNIMLTKSIDLAREEAIKQMVKAKMGVGVLSHLSIAQEVEFGLFKTLTTPLNLHRQLSIVQAPPYVDHHLVNCFVDFIRASNQS